MQYIFMNVLITCDAMINLCYVISLLLHVITPSDINNHGP